MDNYDVWFGYIISIMPWNSISIIVFGNFLIRNWNVFLSTLFSAIKYKHKQIFIQIAVTHILYYKTVFNGFNELVVQSFSFMQ